MRLFLGRDPILHPSNSPNLTQNLPLLKLVLGSRYPFSHISHQLYRKSMENLHFLDISHRTHIFHHRIPIEIYKNLQVPMFCPIESPKKVTSPAPSVTLRCWGTALRDRRRRASRWICWGESGPEIHGFFGPDF